MPDRSWGGRSPSVADRRYWLALWLLLLGGLVVSMLWTPEAGAHATLERAEPPIDGLVIAAPSQLRLFFTEAIAPANPTPTIQVLDAFGEPQAVTEVAVSTADSRQLTATVDGLGTGTYTVAWSVRSSTDGHILSGTYAFRVGGGVPPGSATTDGETPAAWAVATRWLTFAGIALAAAGFLFRQVVLRDLREPAPFRRRRTLAIVIGALLALAASLAEPLLQTLFPSPAVDLALRDAVAGLPGAWWYRPVCLGLVTLLGLSMLALGHDRLPATLSRVGAGLSLLALAGLSLTSHAAGRETWRTLAISVDFLHQVATALWVGGLVLLALWWPYRTAAEGRDEATPGPLRRFSSLALLLVGVGVGTGLVNTGFVFPLLAGIEEYGFTREAFATLWTSPYGLVLITKLLVLLIPLGLAIYHRQAITRAAGAAQATIDRLGPRLGRTIPIETVAVLVVILGGSTMALSAPPVLETAPLDTVILAAPAYTADGTLREIVHVEIDPARPGATDFTVRLTDLMGIPVPTDPEIRFAFTFTSLDHGTTSFEQDLELVDPATTTYAMTGLKLTLEGWWEIAVTVRRQGVADTTARTYLLLPDPNSEGLEAPPEPETMDEAQAIFDRGLQTMTAWSSVRLRERIATGTDVVVITDRAITTGTNDHPPSQEVLGTYSGSFAIRADGELPPQPRENYLHTVTIGEEGWQITPDGTWLESPQPVRPQPPSEWGDIYAQAENIHLGTTTELNGEEVRVITFHTPEQPRQSEAWFSWWVGVDTGNVYRVAMVAMQHYMVTDYSAINEPFVIAGPPAPSGQ